MRSLALLALLGAGAVASPSRAAASPAFCSARDLHVTIGPDVGEPTGQHTLVFVFTNRGAAPCRLLGYPVVVLRSASRALPFVVRQGGDQVVTSARPRPIVLSRQVRAYVAINKYRCDARDLGRVQSVLLEVPGAQLGDVLRLSLPRDGSDFSFCGRGDPGSTISISPFEPSLRATLRQR